MVARSFLFVVISLIVLFYAQWQWPYRLYTMGNHGPEISIAVRFIMGLICFTHIFLSWVMWQSRAKWRASESAMFRFIAYKAVFWAWVFWWTSVQQNGASIPYMIALLLMFVTTVDLDLKLFYRYVLGKDDGPGTNNATIYENQESVVKED